MLLATLVAILHSTELTATSVLCSLDRFIGTGASEAGFSGDGGDASSAKINQPLATWMDTVDDMYIVDSSNQRIRMVDSQEIITTVAGQKPRLFSSIVSSQTHLIFSLLIHNLNRDWLILLLWR